MRANAHRRRCLGQGVVDAETALCRDELFVRSRRTQTRLEMFANLAVMDRIDVDGCHERLDLAIIQRFQRLHVDAETKWSWHIRVFSFFRFTELPG